MCLAVPARIAALIPDTQMADVMLGEVKKTVSVELIDAPKVDDYVLIHVGFALNRISEAEAEKTLALFAEAGIDAGAAV